MILLKKLKESNSIFTISFLGKENMKHQIRTLQAIGIRMTKQTLRVQREPPLVENDARHLLEVNYRYIFSLIQPLPPKEKIF